MFVVLLLFCSCKHKQKEIISIDEDQTIKKLISTKESETLWTREIEGEILNENISQIKGVGNSIQVTPEIMNINEILDVEVYPAIKNFYVLDTTSMDKSLLNNIKAFGEAICKDVCKGPEKFFKKELHFTYTFFKVALQENWESIFNETCTFSFDELVYGSKKITVFDKYLIGKEYKGQDFIEVPVRLYKKNRYVDIIIYVEESKDFSFSNIEIKDWGE